MPELPRVDRFSVLENGLFAGGGMRCVPRFRLLLLFGPLALGVILIRNCLDKFACFVACASALGRSIFRGDMWFDEFVPFVLPLILELGTCFLI